MLLYVLLIISCIIIKVICAGAPTRLASGGLVLIAKACTSREGKGKADFPHCSKLYHKKKSYSKERFISVLLLLKQGTAPGGAKNRRGLFNRKIR